MLGSLSEFGCTAVGGDKGLSERTLHGFPWKVFGCRTAQIRNFLFFFNFYFNFFINILVSGPGINVCVFSMFVYFVR